MAPSGFQLVRKAALGLHDSSQNWKTTTELSGDRSENEDTPGGFAMIVGPRISWCVAAAAIFLVLPQTLQAQSTTSYPGNLTTIHTFSATPGVADAYTPLGGLVVGDDGNLYGTTSLGGPPGVSLGTVFRITPMGDLQILHSFRAGTDGAYPETTLAKGMDGSFYGTTRGLGAGPTAYRVTPGGVFTSFGALPAGLGVPNSLVASRDGNLYGTTLNGFFKLTPAGDMTLLHLFDEATEGARPTPVVEGQDGAFYGMTIRGGTGPGGPGTVFRITTEGKVTVLVTFPVPAKNADGTTGNLQLPTAGLALGSDGNFLRRHSFGWPGIRIFPHDSIGRPHQAGPVLCPQ
jgi:uncharacterized repeat protein (TIGR03803 family)